MQDPILTFLVETQHSVLSHLADAWLATAASGLFLTGIDNRLLAQWPPGIPGEQANLSAPIELNSRQVGQLHIVGDCTPPSQLRLQADAQLLSRLLQLEYDLEKMTTEVIEQQDRLMTLHQLAQTVRVHHGMRHTMANLTRAVTHLLKAESAVIILLTQNHEPRLTAYPPGRWPDHAWLTILPHLDQNSSKQQWLLNQDDPFLCQLDLPIKNLLLQKAPIRQGMALVLMAANKIEGDFQTLDVKLLNMITEPAAEDLENMLLHQELLDQTRLHTEMELATQVQMQLLPQHPPQLPGLEMAMQSKPAFHVGGDFYDFMVTKGQLLTFTVSDVSGKGMPAALMMTMLRTVLRGEAQERDHALPEQILDHTNGHLYDDFAEVSMFATVFLGQYDIKEHILYYANNGHSPVIYRPAAGAAMLLKAEAPPLGVLPENLTCRQMLRLQPGDVLLVATDGFSEAESPNGEMYGYERLLALVDRIAQLPAAQMLQTVFASVDVFSADHPQSDDRTLVIIKRTESNVA